MFTKLENYLVPVILIIVAFFQIYHSQYGNLNPWKGAGFGMFSTNTTNNLNAIGYLSNGDSINIAVQGNKYNVPISKSIISTALKFPKESLLKKIGGLMLTAYFKPDTILFDNFQGDQILRNKIQDNTSFYTHIYIPRFYQDMKYIEREQAVRIEKVKLILYKSYFDNGNSSIKKELIQEIVI